MEFGVWPGSVAQANAGALPVSYAMTNVFKGALMPANSGEFNAPPCLKIGEFRRLMDRLDHARSWLTGGTADEFKRQAVAAQLEPIIVELGEALSVLPARFESDAERARRAIGYASQVVTRWHAVQ